MGCMWCRHLKYGGSSDYHLKCKWAILDVIVRFSKKISATRAQFVLVKQVWGDPAVMVWRS